MMGGDVENVAHVQVAARRLNAAQAAILLTRRHLGEIRF